MQQQTVPTGGFNSSSLNAASAFYLSGLSGGGKGDAILGIGTGNGAGSISFAMEEDDGGTISPGAWQPGTCSYSVAANGRVTLSGGPCTGNLALYLRAPNTGFMLAGAESPTIGQIQEQVIPSGGFTSSSLSGNFYMGTVEVMNQAVNAGVAVVTVSNGSFTMTSDYTSTYAQTPDQTFTGTITVMNSNGTFSTDPSGAIYAIVISSTSAVTIDNSGQAYPTIQLVKQ
jgi:hypothetical protein